MINLVGNQKKTENKKNYGCSHHRVPSTTAKLLLTFTGTTVRPFHSKVIQCLNETTGLKSNKGKSSET